MSIIFFFKFILDQFTSFWTSKTNNSSPYHFTPLGIKKYGKNTVFVSYSLSLVHIQFRPYWINGIAALKKRNKHSFLYIRWHFYMHICISSSTCVQHTYKPITRMHTCIHTQIHGNKVEFCISNIAIIILILCFKVITFKYFEGIL